jgi:hypothetical protein
MPRGMVVPIVFWLCFFGFIAWSIYPHLAQHDARPSRLEGKSQKNQKAEQADSTKEQPASQSPAFRIILKWENPDETDGSKPNCEHPQSHDEADLCEQRQTVLLNGRQVGIGILTLFGLAFTVSFAYRTAEAAIASAEHARTAANAAQESASAARAQIAITERNARIESRAYVHVEEISIPDENPKYQITLAIKIRNFGNTPAYKISIRSNTSQNIIGEPKFDLAETPPLYYSLGPGQEHTTTIQLPVALWTGIIRPMIVKGGRPFYLFGEIRYFDAYQDQSIEEPRLTRFRSEVILADEGIAKGIFVFSDEGNEAT